MTNNTQNTENTQSSQSTENVQNNQSTEYTQSTQSTDIKADAEKNKVWGILAYILFFIPLIAAPKDSPFSRFHTNQGLVLALTAIAINVIMWVFTSIATTTSAFFFPMGIYFALTIFGAIKTVLMLGILALAIYGIVNVVKGLMIPLPIIGKFKILK